MAGHQLSEIRVGDDPASWEAAGFDVRDGEIVIGSTAIVLGGADGERGITAVSIQGVPAESLDGLEVVERSAPVPAAPDHANGVTSWDHLVVMTPDADRTTGCFEAAGLEARRIRTFDVGDVTQRQTFFWLGAVILELVGGHHTHGDGAASPWGIALTCPDLDSSVAWLGERCGAAKDAVQSGRRIATVRTRDLDISVPIALMSPHH